MPVYRNQKSGVTFSTPCICAGEDWEEVKSPPPKATKVKKKPKVAETEFSDVKEIPNSEAELFDDETDPLNIETQLSDNADTAFDNGEDF